jgi:hypothetical protein
MFKLVGKFVEIYESVMNSFDRKVTIVSAESCVAQEIVGKKRRNIICIAASEPGSCPNRGETRKSERRLGVETVWLREMTCYGPDREKEIEPHP